ncbi:MAG TPA: hypothetical protein VGM51_15185 [Armatimonadota bacterium]
MKPLHWIVLVSLLAVFIAPPTRRAAYEQARLVLGLTPPEAYAWPAVWGAEHVPHSLAKRRTTTYKRLAAAHTDDIGLQMAVAIESVPFSFTEFPKANVYGLRPLLKRYPRSPVLYAALLQYGSQCLGDVGNEYKAASPKYQPMRDAIDPRPAHPLPRVTFAEYDGWAAAGERLEPDNAWFTAMRAVGYSQQHRSGAALAAMERAAKKEDWEDYDSVLTVAVTNLPIEAYGRTDPLVFPRMMTLMSGTLRSALYETTRDESRAAEKAGHIEEGLRIRRSAWHLARLWRLNSRTAIGAMSSDPVTSAALRGLGGPEKRDPNLTNVQQRAAHRKAVLSWLDRTGHRSDADFLRRDMAQRDEMYAIIKAGLHKADSVRIMVWAAATWGAAATLFNAALWLALLAMAVSWVAGTTGRRGLRRLTAWAVAIALLAWQARAMQGFFADAPVALSPFAIGCLAAAAFAFSVPLVLYSVFALTALLRRKPFRKSVGDWLRASIIPTACVLAMLFVGVSIWGVKPQRTWRENLYGQTFGEVKYYAHLVGKTWPE